MITWQQPDPEMATHSIINRRQTTNDGNGSCKGRLISVPRRMRLLEGVTDHGKSIKMSKLLINVTFQGSLGVVQVVISPDATVGDLIKTAVEIYLREERRPLLAEPVDVKRFELHYSPFSFECLDPEQKLRRMTSRNCFLCAKPAAAATSSSVCCSDGAKANRSITTKESFSLTKLMDHLLNVTIKH